MSDGPDLRPRCRHPTTEGKVAYRSPAAARRAARLLRGGKSREAAGLPWRAYKCPWCSGWHLTTHGNAER